jgi:hypothetical protein
MQVKYFGEDMSSLAVKPASFGSRFDGVSVGLMIQVQELNNKKVVLMFRKARYYLRRVDTSRGA